MSVRSFALLKKASIICVLALSVLAVVFFSFYLGISLSSLGKKDASLTALPENPSIKAPLPFSNVSRFLSSNEQKSIQPISDEQKISETMTRSVEKGSSINSYKLAGTMITDKKKLAVFEDLKTNRQHIVREGDTLSDFSVIQIFRKSVTLQTASLTGGDKGLSSVNKDSNGSSLVVKKIGPHHYEIAKRMMMDNLQDPAKFLQQVRLVPFIDNEGKSGGFILKNMKESSFLREIGLKEGDIITKINGKSLNDTFTAIRQFASLADLQSVFIELSRKDEHIVLKYTIR